MATFPNLAGTNAKRKAAANRTPLPRAAWRSKEWLQAVPISHAQLCEWLVDGTVPSVRIGGARFITESPTAFLERHREHSEA